MRHLGTSTGYLAEAVYDWPTMAKGRCYEETARGGLAVNIIEC
ncbi:hypothetical protein [Streptomyces inhibens]|nr:hypothetical protein [Streptomyces inhibens]